MDYTNLESDEINEVLKAIGEGNHAWYNAFHHIAVFALPMVRLLSERKDSVPGALFPEGYTKLDGEERQEAFGEAQGKWNGVLSRIEYALECVAEETHEEHPAEVRDGLELFAKHFLSLWD